MDIQKIKCFLTVAVTGSFSEAAEKLYVSQSAISKQIISLEKELNVKLINRSKRKISITEEGKILLRHTETIMDAYNQLVVDLSIFSSYSGGKLSIATLPVMAQYNITSLIAAFRRLNPMVNMIIDEREGNEIIPALEGNTYEFAFMRSDNLDMAKFDILPLFTDKLYLVLPLNHKYARCDSVSLSMVKDEGFLFLDKGTMLYDICVDACEHAGFSPNVLYTGTRVENIAELISAGMGISLLMGKVVTYLKNPNIAIIPFKESVVSHISLVRIKKRKISKPAKLFYDFIEEHNRKNQ